MNKLRFIFLAPFFFNLQENFGLFKTGLSPNLSQNFGQILTRALGLTTLSELHLEVVAPRFEEIQGRQRERQQTLAFRYRRRSPTELGYRGECPTYWSSVTVELEYLERQRLP